MWLHASPDLFLTFCLQVMQTQQQVSQRQGPSASLKHNKPNVQQCYNSRNDVTLAEVTNYIQITRITTLPIQPDGFLFSIMAFEQR